MSVVGRDRLSVQLHLRPRHRLRPSTLSLSAYDVRCGLAIVLCKRRQFIAHGSVHGGTLCCATRRLKKEENKEEREAEHEEEEMEDEG